MLSQCFVLSRQSSQLSRCFLLAVTMLLLSMRPTAALTCFETNDDGDMVEVASDDFKYCVLVPERMENNQFVKAMAFGVGSESDSTSVYDRIFELNDDVYQILTMCIHERYDIQKVSPKFMFKNPEYMFRCFCNYDLCNRDKNFFGYLNKLKEDTAVRDNKVLQQPPPVPTKTERRRR